MGKYTYNCFPGYRGVCIEALRKAEQKKADGEPPFVLEIAAEWSSLIPMMSPLHLLVGLLDVYRNDEVLADLEHNRFSLNPKHQSSRLLASTGESTEFELYSDRIVRVYPTYILDERLRIRPGPETLTINF